MLNHTKSYDWNYVVISLVMHIVCHTSLKIILLFDLLISNVLKHITKEYFSTQGTRVA